MKIMRNLILCTLLLGSQTLVAMKEIPNYMKIGDIVPQDMVAKLQPCKNPHLGDIVVFKVKDNYKFGKIDGIDDDVCSIFYGQRTMRPMSELFILPEEKVAKTKRSGKVPDDLIAKLQPCKNPQVGDIVAVKTRSRGWIFGKIKYINGTEYGILFKAFKAKEPMPFENSELFMVPEEEGPRAEAKESVKKERAEGEEEEEESEAGD